MLCRAFAASCALLGATSIVAQEVRLTGDKAGAEFTINGTVHTITRNPNPAARIPDAFTLTSRSCPPFCIQPFSAGDGIETVGELEVVAFLEEKVAASAGVLMDSRLPEFHVAGTIPGAVNVPFSILDPANPYLPDILRVLGAVDGDGAMDFTNALDLVLFCNGPWSDQSARAIQSLVDAGYPPAKLRYYRGGMQDWLSLGLTVQIPQGDG
jgi:rhodanese-related sulfurtransferase